MAAVIGAEAEIDIAVLNHGYDSQAISSSTSSFTGDGGISHRDASSAHQPYNVVADEATPLLLKSERMSAQISSPIEVAGIEGAEGAERPWLRIPESKKKPWWDTPSVCEVLCDDGDLSD